MISRDISKLTNFLFYKVLLMINVSFLTEIQQNFKYTFLDVFFSKESENDDKSWKKCSFKAKN